MEDREPRTSAETQYLLGAMHNEVKELLKASVISHNAHFVFDAIRFISEEERQELINFFRGQAHHAISKASEQSVGPHVDMEILVGQIVAAQLENFVLAYRYAIREIDLGL